MILSYLGLIPEIAVFVLCIYYFSAKKTMDGMLLCIGSGIGLSVAFFYCLLPIIGNDLFSSSNFYTYTGIVSFVASVCFAIGLGILITDKIKQKNN
jgi:hypothetical protein